MRSAGKGAHTNCCPNGGEQLGSVTPLSVCPSGSPGSLLRAVCSKERPGTSSCWGFRLCDPRVGPWDPLWIQIFRNLASWTQGPVQNRDVMAHVIYCSYHWADALNLTRGILGSRLGEIRNVSQVVKKEVIVLCVVSWKW